MTRRAGRRGRGSRLVFTLAVLAAVVGLAAAAARWLAPRLRRPHAAVAERAVPAPAAPSRTPGAAEEITNEERRALEAVLGGGRK